MNRDEIFDKVRDVVVEQLYVEEDDVQLDSSIVDDLGADELDYVEIIMALEEEFNVSIPDEMAGDLGDPKLKTIGDMVDAVQQCL